MKKSKLNQAQEELQSTIQSTNTVIEELGKHNSDLYRELVAIQNSFDKIRNVPEDKKLEYENAKTITSNWYQSVEQLREDYKVAVGKSAGTAAAGVGTGAAIATLAPSAAMGIATTFGVASTGTAISSLSGAAATNAALAWLGGGALSAGGGGIAAGNALLALAGPIGIITGGVIFAISGLMFVKAQIEKNRLEEIFCLITDRDIYKYDLAKVELNERIIRVDNETDNLRQAVNMISSFGTDYDAMSEEQQYTLGSYLNFMNASAQLLVNPIKGLADRIAEDEYRAFLSSIERKADMGTCEDYKNVIIALANWLNGIKLDDKDKKLVCSFIKSNKDMLKMLELEKEQLSVDILDAAIELAMY
ncbi:hypothetical protein SAMN05216413_2271 [Ruminococcaceae bacterium KH2T8]|nr:hypothetical protein SAMN05216413_2271 [Ruminococcaceae bacterium KH2T8]